MRCNFSRRVVNDVFLLRLQRKSSQNVQALFRTARVPLDHPVSHPELLQVEHERRASGTPPIFGVNLLARELSPSERYCSSLGLGVAPGDEYHAQAPANCAGSSSVECRDRQPEPRRLLPSLQARHINLNVQLDRVR